MMRLMNPGEGLGNETSVFKDLPGFVELDQVESLTYQQQSLRKTGKRMSFHWFFELNSFIHQSTTNLSDDKISI